MITAGDESTSAPLRSLGAGAFTIELDRAVAGGEGGGEGPPGCVGTPATVLYIDRRETAAVGAWGTTGCRVSMSHVPPEWWAHLATWA